MQTKIPKILFSNLLRKFSPLPKSKNVKKTHLPLNQFSTVPNRPMRGDRRRDVDADGSEDKFLRNLNFRDRDDAEKTNHNLFSRSPNRPARGDQRPMRRERDVCQDFRSLGENKEERNDGSLKIGEGEKEKDQSGDSLLEKLNFGDISTSKKADESRTNSLGADPSVPEMAAEDADEIFKKMKETGLIPNAVAMLDGLCKDGLVQEAMKLFGLMREKGTIPEVVIYTAVVEGFCKAAKFDDAKRIFRKMQKNGIVPNAFSYVVVIQGLCKGKRLDDVIEFCMEMLDAGHSPNAATLTGIVSAICKEKGVEEAEGFVRSLREKGFAIDGAGGSRLLIVLFLSSFFLNIYSYLFFSSSSHSIPGPGWSRRAAVEAEAVAARTCSGHGRAFLDSVAVEGEPRCECNTCYAGDDCSVLMPACPADADSGDPLYLEPYWQQHAASSAVVVSGWHRMSYKADGDNYISLELEKHIRLLHRSVGNAAADGRFIVFGTGSTQLLNAVVYALSPDSISNPAVPPAKVVASVPYYGLYRAQTTLFDFRENEWEGITSKWANSSSNSDFIEFVTSPNNPDGRLQQSVLGGSSVIYDHCYYWPHYTAIPTPADEDVMLFSMSKISGHAGSRFGWALLRDEEVYKKVQLYLGVNTVGVSRDTQLRVLKIIRAILQGVGGRDDIFEFGHKITGERWERLSKLLSSSKRFSLQQISPRHCTYFQKVTSPSPAYGWLRCEMEEDRDCAAVLRDAGIVSRGGAVFEADSRYTRLSLIKTQDDFEQLMQKMEALVSNEGLSSVM